MKVPTDHLENNDPEPRSKLPLQTKLDLIIEAIAASWVATKSNIISVQKTKENGLLDCSRNEILGTLELCNRLYPLYVKANFAEKAQIANVVASNYTLVDVSLVPKRRRPFSIFAERPSSTRWLPREGSPHVSLRDCRQNTPDCELANLRLADQPCGEEAK